GGVPSGERGAVRGTSGRSREHVAVADEPPPAGVRAAARRDAGGRGGARPPHGRPPPGRDRVALPPGAPRVRVHPAAEPAGGVPHVRPGVAGRLDAGAARDDGAATVVVPDEQPVRAEAGAGADGATGVGGNVERRGTGGDDAPAPLRPARAGGGGGAGGR